LETLRELKGWRLEGRSLHLDCGWGGQVSVTPVSFGVVQVRLQHSTPWHIEEAAPSLVIDPDTWPEAPAPQVLDAGSHLNVTCPGVRVQIDKAPVRLHYWAAVASEDPQLEPADATSALLSDSPDCGIFSDGWSTGARFRLHEQDGFYGLGEPHQLGGPIPLDHRGRRYPIWNKHLPAPSRMVMPVLISRRGYGLFVDNPWPAEWDLGTDGATFGYTAQAGQFTLYFIAGPDLTTVLDRFTQLTGRPSLPPKWALGLLQSKFGYRNHHEVEALVAEFAARETPLDCVILDLYWFRRMGDMAFDRKAFPDPGELLRTLRKLGIRVIVIEEPYVTTQSRLFAEGDRLGLFGRRPEGGTYTFPFWAGQAALVDFTQPLARQWWADQHKPLMDLGVSGWWTDLNEPEVHPADMVHHGGPAAAVHNVYALQMICALDLAQQQHKPGERLFILSRSGWPGIQSLGAGTWSGDVRSTWEALDNQPALGLAMGMAGIPSWNTDIGGFEGGPPSPELYVRWMQFGAFTPIMRPHGCQQPREPWAFGPEAESIVERFIRLRYRLLPYTYTLAREANLVGLPFMRPLALHYPHDLRTRDLRDEYLWGRDILVAPVTTPRATSRRVYLPAGTWYDYWTNRRIRGGRTVSAAAPLDLMPLFIRAGAIIPLAPDRPRAAGAWDDLKLAVYPGDDISAFDLYEDDGESLAYKDGIFALTHFTCAWSDEGLTVTVGTTAGGYAGQPAQRRYRLEVRLRRRPQSVLLVDGQQLTARRSAASLADAASGWWYDRFAKVVHVKLAATAVQQRVLFT